ncbi:histidine phosphatase family protein [Mycobacterium sp. 21AC1]|uniref:histidine phosphatase family protein n=1 Tax=[Mycobacterium] appelbergii TaxID=2939269 RepID=UPI00293909C8|nr:histidine phosphatase family protein [Mycobacterium sp. 21AC1]MDV3125892.1 histidine phosphatase family protein [Mycobacterium sp. 21AC1]
MNDPSHPDASDIGPVGRRRRGAAWRYLGVALASFALLMAAAIPAAAAELMRVTFVRHAESAGNASGLIDTSTPGPVLTSKGQQQAKDVADLLGDNNYDAIYASTMVRTQLTAAPMSQYLGLPIQVLPGLQEIEAGVFEGTPEADAAGGYGLYPIGWTFPGVIPQIPVEYFNKGTKMPGTNLDGYAFDARVDGALQTIYDNGDRNAVVFSHGGTIMFWTMMNVQNLTVMEKLQLLQTAQLDNTDYVVVEGNNEDGWTLVNWNGKEFAPEPTLGAEVKLQARTLKRQLAAAAQQVTDAFATRDLATIATAVNRSIADASYSVVKFRRAVTAKVIHEIDQAIPDSQAPSSSDVPAVKPEADAVQELKAPVTDPTPSIDRKSKALAVSKTSPIKADTTANGATDLTNGNKAAPGKPATSSVAPGRRVQEAVKDMSDNVATAVQKLGDTVKKLTGAKTTKPGDTDKSDTTKSAGAGGAGDTGSSQRDAA